jgi:hypothetical protein
VPSADAERVAQPCCRIQRGIVRAQRSVDEALDQAEREHRPDPVATQEEVRRLPDRVAVLRAHLTDARERPRPFDLHLLERAAHDAHRGPGDRVAQESCERVGVDVLREVAERV